MKHMYDRSRARNLIPLLRSISQELRERTHTIRFLEGRLRHLERQDLAGSDEGRDLQARLAVQRRELRIAKKELARLGCSMDETHPFRILIPGADGGLEKGFVWNVGDASVQVAAAETAA